MGIGSVKHFTTSRQLRLDGTTFIGYAKESLLREIDNAMFKIQYTSHRIK
jgi:hypothetical protein